MAHALSHALPRAQNHLESIKGRAITFRFEGPIPSIYATLAVRLSHTGIFTKKELWKNAITYSKRGKGTYGLCLNLIQDGLAELVLFFDADTTEDGQVDFEEFVYTHLRRRARPETIQRRRTVVCKECGVALPDHIIRMRRERHFDWLICPVCSQRIFLPEDESSTLTLNNRISVMIHSADQARSRAVFQSILDGKRATRDFDVFLCYNKIDKAEIREIGKKLMDRGILPWLDEWELQPGIPWQ